MAPDDRTPTRRRFLEATAAASVTALAGCNESGAGTTTLPTDGVTAETIPGGDPTTTGTTPTESITTTPSVNFDGYPYGVGESRTEDARKVMEDAGYGPDNRFELEWWQLRLGEGRPLEKAAKRIKSHLERAHVDMEVNVRTTYLPYLAPAQDGEWDTHQLGWAADYPAPENFLRLVYPPNTNYHGENTDTDGAYLYWTADSHHGAGRERAMTAFDRLRNNPEPTEEAARIRASGVRDLEAAVWTDMPMMPLVHFLDERVWYDRVDWTPPGTLGDERQKKHAVSVAGEDRLRLVGGSFATFDPVQATDAADERVVTQVFDAPFNHRNATTTVDPLLVTETTTSEDFTTYTASLQRGVRFHDGSDLTADDVVYSLRRVAESEHSNHVDLLADVLGVSHDVVAVLTDEDGAVTDEETVSSATFATEEFDGYRRDRVVPGSLAVEAVDDHTVRVELDRPFAHVESVLADPAFSVVPEGVVGDVEGYDGNVSHETFVRNPVGCGPFAFEEWTRGESVSVERFEGYHGALPTDDRGATRPRSVGDIRGIRWEVIEDSSKVYERFLEGAVDVGRIPARRFDPVNLTIDRTDDFGRRLGTYGPLATTGETVDYAAIPQLSTSYLGFNCERVPLAVRRAVAYVTNMEEFVDDFFGTRAISAYHLTPPNLFPGGPGGYDQHYRG